MTLMTSLQGLLLYFRTLLHISEERLKLEKKRIASTFLMPLKL